MKPSLKSHKAQHLTQFALIMGIIVVVNIVSSLLFTRIDLTSDNRYTISKATKDLIRNIDEPMLFKVYLEGDMPAGYKRLRNEAREMLIEFKAYNRNVVFEFIDPNSPPDKGSRKALQQQLYSKGLLPRQISDTRQGKVESQTIFPGAIVSYQGREYPMAILKNQLGRPDEEMINNSVQQLEYTFASTVKVLTTEKKPTVAFTTGHGELSEYQTYGAAYAMSSFYDVDRVELNGNGSALFQLDPKDSMTLKRRYDAIIIARPDSAFSRLDGFLIDQFIMHGGKVLWFVDPVFASLDSLQDTGSTLGLRMSLGIEQQLFNYGARLNSNLIKDLNCMPLPMNTQPAGARPEFRPFPWYFSPILSPVSTHPIVKNLNDIKTEFISSIDTVQVPGIRKTILLTSSRYSKTENSPVPIHISLMLEQQNPDLYNEPYLPVAVLLEGEFPSFWESLPVPMQQVGLKKIDRSPVTSMLVVADGDIIRNQTQPESNGQVVPLPLGYDRYTQTLFGNQDFLLNALNYMLDDSGLLESRTKDFKIRRLDPKKLENNSIILRWQIINVAAPILLVVAAGLLIIYLRRRRYSRIA
ncbi:MAG TPA: gliding motility-associated ABC transporter substrate-binding protein GldG [Bacteroidales bacterium]|nr:gliding motility-associated ABC transporter substrate-binding protein GldG [Bacteroidales bacterium]HRZ50108.1 gliding motility-associated ABC transporter substrate-binding protein GldG [Bacteroidales bacterium]